MSPYIVTFMIDILQKTVYNGMDIKTSSQKVINDHF